MCSTAPSPLQLLPTWVLAGHQAQVCSYLKRMAGDLESAAHPALDALTSHVSTTNLERVRRIKNRMVRLTTRVETVSEPAS